MPKPTAKITRRIQSEQVMNAFVQVVRPRDSVKHRGNSPNYFM